MMNFVFHIIFVSMIYSSFPTIGYVMFTHIFDLSSWCLHIFWFAYVMFLMIWKMCAWPFVNRTLYFNYFLYVMILFCFCESCYIRRSIIGSLISEICRNKFKTSKICGKYFKKSWIRTTFLIQIDEILKKEKCIL